MIARFFSGMGYFGRGFAFAFGRRTLAPWVLLPALLTLVVTLGGAVFAWHYVALVAHRHAGDSSIAGALFWLLAVLAVGACAYLLYVACCLVATAPFAGLLSERTETAATGVPLPPAGLGHALRLSLRGAAHALIGVTLYLAITAPLFVLHWLVPPLAPLCWVASLVQTTLFFAFDGFNEPLHRRGRGFVDKWRFIRGHLAESLGFGFVVALLMAVPLVSVLVAPLAVVGGTLLHADLEAAATRRRGPAVL
jgi:CysZ protein